MDVASLNTQNAMPYGQQPEPRAVEAAAEEAVSSVLAVNTPNPNNTEQLNQEEEKNPLMVENLDDRQIEDMLSKGVTEANKKLAITSNELQYSYHKKTRSIAVKVVDSATKEVIREIPPQKALDALAKIWELAGILVDEKQ